MARARALLCLLLALPYCTNSAYFGAQAAFFSYRVIRTLHHRPEAFTQGLIWQRGADGVELLIEGTGLYRGQSSIASFELVGDRFELRNGPFRLSSREFGEGISILDGRLYQLTWKEKTVHVRDPDTLELERTYVNPGSIKQGWGLSPLQTSRGPALAWSDGSSLLHFVRPDPNAGDGEALGAIDRVVGVHRCVDGGSGVTLVRGINELESVPTAVTHPHRSAAAVTRDTLPSAWDRDEAGRNAMAEGVGVDAPVSDELPDRLVWANIFGSSCVAVIRPDTGRIVAWVLLDGLNKFGAHNVYNGIAYRESDGALWVTGKNWGSIYQIELVPMSEAEGAKIDVSRHCHATLTTPPVTDVAPFELEAAANCRNVAAAALRAQNATSAPISAAVTKASDGSARTTVAQLFAAVASILAAVQFGRLFREYRAG